MRKLCERAGGVQLYARHDAGGGVDGKDGGVSDVAWKKHVYVRGNRVSRV